MQTLSSDQIASLAAAIVATAETLGQTISANAAQLMAEDLAEYPAEHVAAALRACRRELTGRFTLAAILERTQAADGRPGKDEAWSIALAGNDEFNTVVLTHEIQQAMSVSAPILELGDKVGARMAFISAYERLVADARREKTPVNWSVSLGFDPDLRARAIEEAVRLKQLPRHVAEQEIARLSYDGQPSADGLAIAGLITGRVSKPSERNRERFQKLKCDIEQAEKDRKAREKAERAAHMAAFEKRRAQAMQELERREAGQP